jgi:hypothetical protein
VSHHRGTNLGVYISPTAWTLTVDGELNKLAFNIGIARVMAGIHWRSDVIEGNRLGQEVAISILQDMQPAYNEPFSDFTLTKFDGTTFQL